MNDHAIDTFQDFLETIADSVHELHFVFDNGTVVRVSADDIAGSGSPFTESYIEEWPLHLLEDPDEFNAIVQDNVQRYNHDCDSFTKGYARAAYTLFLSAGYLEPGPESDRNAIHIGDDVYVVNYPNTGNSIDLIHKKVFSLVYVPRDATLEADDSIVATSTDAQAEAAASAGGDLRRLDWMFPGIKTVIGKVSASIIEDRNNGFRR